LLERLKAGIFRNVGGLVDVLKWVKLIDLLLCFLVDNVCLGVFGEVELAHLLILKLLLLQSGHFVDDLDAVELRIIYILHSAGSKNVVFALGVLYNLIHLFLGQKLNAIAVRVQNEHPWIYEILGEWVLAEANSFNVLLRLKVVLRELGIPLVVSLPFFMLQLLQAIVVFKEVLVGLVVVRAKNMHFVAIVRKMAVIHVRSILSTWLVHLFEVVGVVS